MKEKRIIAKPRPVTCPRCGEVVSTLGESLSDGEFRATVSPCGHELTDEELERLENALLDG